MMKCWGNHLGDVWAFVNYCIKYNHHELSATDVDGNPIDKKIYEIFENLDTSFEFDVCYSDKKYATVNQFDAWSTVYIPTIVKWHQNNNGIITHQLDGGRLHADLKGISRDFKLDILQVMRSRGYVEQSVGGEFSLSECIKHMSESAFFIGIDSGMSHVAHSVGVPIILIESNFDFRPYHVCKQYKTAKTIYDIASIIYKGPIGD